MLLTHNFQYFIGGPSQWKSEQGKISGKIIRKEKTIFASYMIIDLESPRQSSKKLLEFSNFQPIRKLNGIKFFSQ